MIDEARADVHFALPGFKFDGYDSGQADMMLGLFVLACEECGFVRLYHRSVIAACYPHPRFGMSNKIERYNKAQAYNHDGTDISKSIS